MGKGFGGVHTIERDVGRGKIQPNLTISVMVVGVVPIRAVGEEIDRLGGANDSWLALRVPP
jgi:hypothetical protein